MKRKSTRGVMVALSTFNRIVPVQAGAGAQKLVKRLLFNKTLRYWYFYNPEHPLANKCGVVYYHRHVLSVKLGRWLTPREYTHHLDGNRENNSPDNLVLVTIRSHGEFHGTKQKHPCKRCGKMTKKKLYCCAECSHLASRKFNVTKKELQRLLWEMPTTKVAKLFGVTDKAIERRSKLLQISKPPRGYWKKIQTG